MDTPVLNLPEEYTSSGGLKFQVYQPYFGTALNQMPRLLRDQRIPMSVAHILARNVQLNGEYREISDAWRENAFYTSDLFEVSGEDISLILTTLSDGTVTPHGRKYLDMISPNAILSTDQSIILDKQNNLFNGYLDGSITVKREKLAKAFNAPLVRKEAESSLFWRFMLRHPDEVPREFSIPDLFYEVIEKSFSLNDLAMAVYLEQCLDTDYRRMGSLKTKLSHAFADMSLCEECMLIGAIPGKIGKSLEREV